MSSLLDIVVGQLALRGSLVSSDQLQDCVVEQLRPPHPPLGQVLVRRRLVSPVQLLSIMQAAERTRLNCSRCRRGYHYPQLNPTAEPLCPTCGGVLGLDGVAQQRPGMHNTLALTRPDTTPGVTRGGSTARRPPTHRDTATSSRHRPGTDEFAGSFGGYVIGEELGRGGMGVVYKAKSPRSDGPIALKILLGGEMASRNQVARFKREAEIASRLEHRNIVRIHDVGVEGDYYYFTMDLVEGVPLSKLIKKRQLGVRRSAEIARDVARGLGHAHKSDVIHRDIKPDNIIVDLDGNPVITDFGLAREMDPEVAARLTRSGALVGTPFYMSPEQASGKGRDVKATADIYSLGVVLFEMLTLQLPFLADTQLELTSKIVHDDPPSMRALEPDVHKDLETIVFKALCKDPEDRYASADDMADDLDRYLDGESIKARRKNIAQVLWRRSQRNKRMLLMATAGAIVVAVSTLAVAKVVTSITDEEDQQAADQQAADQQAADQQQQQQADDEVQKAADAAVAAVEEAFTHAERTPAGEEYRNALDAGVRRVTQALTHPLNQKNASLVMRRGRAQERLRREDLARADYERCRDLNPKAGQAAEASYLLARMHMRAERRDDARDVLVAQRQVDERHGASNPSPWRSMCESMLRYLDGDPEGALSIATSIRKDNPQLVEAYSIEAGMLIELGRIQEALRVLERSVTIDPKEALIWSNLAQIRLMVNPSRGKEDVKRALELDPDNETALTMRAAVAQAEGRLEEAIVDLRRVLGRHPEDVEVLCTLATYYHAARQGTLCDQMLKRVERVAPLDPRPYEFRSMSYLRSSDLQRAASELRRGIRAVYTDPKAREGLIEKFQNLVIETKQLEAAEQWVRDQLAQRPEDPDVLAFRVTILHAGDRDDEAKELLETLRSKFPKHHRSWRLWLRMGATTYKWKASRLEVELLRYAGAVASDAEGKSWLAKFHVMAPQGDPMLAKRYANEALKLDENNSDAHLVLGLIANRTNDLRLSREHLVRALKCDPLSTDAMAIMGAVEFNMGNPKAAEPYLRQCLANDPFQLSAMEGLGHVLVRLNRNREAAAMVEQYMTICRDSGTKPEAPILVPYIRAKIKLNQAEEMFNLLAGLAKTHNEPNYRVLLAQALANAGRIVQCQQVLDKVLQEHPDNEAAKSLKLDIEKKLKERDAPGGKEGGGAPFRPGG